MSQPAARIDRDLAAWLDDQPDRAPAGLLGAVLSRSRRTAQRPSLVALALGAPVLAWSRGGVLPIRRGALVAAGLVILALAVAVVASGALRPAIVVEPSPGGTQPPSSRPSPTTAAFAPSPTVPHRLAGDYENAAMGIALRAPSNAIILGEPEAVGRGVTRLALLGSDDTLLSGPVGAQFTVGLSGFNPVDAFGVSIDGFTTGWLQAYPQTTVEDVSRSGWPVRLLFAARGDIAAAFAVTTAHAVLLMSVGSGSSARLRTLVSELDLLDQPPGRAALLDLTVSIPNGWSGGRHGATIEANGAAVSGLPGPQLAIEYAYLPAQIDVDLGQQGSTVTVEGSTFDTLAASIKATIAGGAAPTTERIDGWRVVSWATPQQSYVGPLTWIALIDHGSRVYLITRHQIFDGPTRNADARTLLGGIHLDP